MATRAERFTSPIAYDEAEDNIAIGAVVPFDFGIDWEYWRYLPRGVSLYFTRTPYLRKPVGLELAKEVGRPSTVARATKALTALRPAAVLYACASGSFVRGIEGERELRRVMRQAGALRATTASGAMLDALRACEATKVAVATPYTDLLTDRLVSFIEEGGIEVVSAVNLGIKTGIAGVSRSTVADLIRHANRSNADAVFVGCTSLRTFGMVADLEHEIDRPILTSNQVTLWHALWAAGALRRDEADLVDSGWVLGGGHPKAHSTDLLMKAAEGDFEPLEIESDGRVDPEQATEAVGNP